METTTAKPKKQLDELSFNQLARVRAALTQQIAEAEDVVKGLKAKREKLDVEVLRRFSEQGLSSVKTELGSLHTITRTSVSCADKDVFMEWVLKNDNLDFLEVRPAKAMVSAYMEEIDETTQKAKGLPPGLNWSSKLTVGVRKA